MSEATVNKVIEEFSGLPIEDKEYLAEIMKKQIIEAKREKLAERAKEARLNFQNSMTRTGTVRDLMEDLDSD